MSRESLHELNAQTLIGNTDAHGHAWHHRAVHRLAHLVGAAALALG